MDMIWLMLALASMAIAYIMATFKKYRSNLGKVLANLAHFTEENVKLQEELSHEVLSKDEDARKIEEGKEQIETNKGRVGELEDKIKNDKKTRETLTIKSQSWKLDR